MRLSVITPFAADRGQWLPEAAASVQRSRTLLTPAGIDIEWVLCQDGEPAAPLPPGTPAAGLPAGVEPDLLVGWQTRRGISAARNAALSVATGDWVTPLDADDELEPAGVLAAATVARAAPESLGWLGCNRLLTDGSRTPHWRDQPQAFAAGELAETWTSPFAFHPNSVLLRRETLLQAGGWPALGVNEDLAAVLLVSEASTGRAEPAVLNRYRVWDSQEVASASYRTDKATAFILVEALLNARRRAAGRPPVHHPTPGPAHGRIRAAQPLDGAGT